MATRREFLKMAGACAAGGAVIGPATLADAPSGPAAGAGRPAGRPNILYIQPDQQRYDCLGRSGHPMVRTPNLDKLAAEGMWFPKAFTPIPTCCPARQTLLSGLWPESHGGYWNYDAFMPPPAFASHTWTEDLREAGYRMGYVGKWHVHPTRGPKEFGFEDFASAADYGQWRRTQKLGPIEKDSFAWFGGRDPAPKEQTKTHWYARKAIELIRSYAAGGKSWHLRLDFEEPHLPCHPTKEFLDMYRAEDIKPWGNFPDAFKNKPYIQRQQLYSWGIEKFTWDDWRRYVWRYLAMISQVDDAIGQVLKALDELGQRENTIVVYTSDHGDACGGHGMIDKHYIFYEDVVHIPLIVRWPAVVRAKSQCDQFVITQLDMASTLAEAGGCRIPPAFQGRSLMPILAGQTPGDWRKAAFSTYNGQQFGLHTMRMVRTDTWKYVWNLTDVDELYNLAEDPWELTNRAGDAGCAAVLKDLRGQLLAELDSRNDPAVKRSPWARGQLANGAKCF